jgi:hypothetical protein
LDAPEMTAPLTNEELIELTGVVMDNINGQFELWLTITFGVIIASYVAGHRLSRFLQWALATLYLLVSVLLLLVLASVVEFRDAMIGEGSEAMTGISTVYPLIPWLRLVIWIVGTVVTMIFIFRGRREREG